MKKRSLLWVILGCGLLVVGFAECDMGASTTSALDSVPCDAGSDALCPVVRPPAPPPSGGW